MLRNVFSLSEPDLERELLRKGVDHRLTGTRCCADCGRVPLVGERVYRFAGDATVCELCRSSRREVPTDSELMYHGERGLSVRLRPLQRAA